MTNHITTLVEVSTLHRTTAREDSALHACRIAAWRCLAMSPFRLPIGKALVNVQSPHAVENMSITEGGPYLTAFLDGIPTRHL